jgi:hypothetical protein
MEPIQFRQSYFHLGRGAYIEFVPGAHPYIQWTHIDGPVLHLRNATMEWLTLWERFLVWIGREDAFSLERKHAPEFVARWNAKLRLEGHLTDANAKAYGCSR